MYFPDREFLPYLKELDTRVRENANKDMFQCYGQDLVTVTTTSIMHNKELRRRFHQCILAKSKDADVQSKAVDNVYKEFTRKLCNTRLNEFLESQRLLMVANKGKATLSGQNLRDSLLSQHVNLKSTKKINTKILWVPPSFHTFSFQEELVVSGVVCHGSLYHCGGY